MKKLYEALRQELQEGRGAVLCGILESDGSTPRGAGAKMLLLEDGRALGTIGGGAVEFSATGIGRKLLEEKRSKIQEYRLAPGGSTEIQLGMICGGNVRVGFQYFDPAQPEHRELVDRILRLMEESRSAWSIVEFRGDSWQGGTYDRREGLVGLPESQGWALDSLLVDRGVVQESEETDTVRYGEPIGQSGSVYLFGAGHVGRALTAVLGLAEYQVVVYDQRPEVATREMLPAAAKIFCGPYSEAVERLPEITEDDCVVIMTPGHQADFEVLSQVLRTKAGYIGCIGSRKKVAATRERLLQAGFAPEEIDKVYAPIGLPIGGETPGEIAVSVAAQIIAHRAGKLNGKELGK